MRILKFLLVIILLAGAAGGGYWAWLRTRPPVLPAGFVSADGRIEAQEVDIAAKYAARVLSIEFEEGQLVQAGTILARLDVRDVQSQYRAAAAALAQARKTRDQAASLVVQRQSDLDFANKEMNRANELFTRGNVSQQRVDSNRNQLRSAAAALQSAKSGLSAADEAIRAAEADADRMRDLADDGILKAPVTGRILYKLAQPGEMLGAGGKVATLLDLSDVYMTFFLPTEYANRVALGAEVRLLLDALPGLAVPAAVSFVAPKAQFTPKQVETRAERDRMMFRIKARVPQALVTSHIEQVKTGVSGTAYVRLDAQAAWPAWLQSRLTTTAPQ
ncbi:HlyD family secretion protein [Nitrospirillum pindoramense]|uniref:HlyD family secretion protein n=1 Tax=Nitrospirillum amazonense TaxID=28077 RepID=A0A560HBB3_9PROT|nr:HlyD family efflux transporter periplasmic adaptor subunit [Nitrospirillum amazonense]TWB43632.1 HlyD family secretion protein [Nitrospirillum amazonense]